MDSGRIHLPPIQDMLCRRLSFTEESPISPVSSTCSSNSSSHITHKSPSPTTDTYLHWEQRSADKYDQDMRQHVGYTQLDSGKYNGTYPLHHSRSYSDPFLPRKSSACSITSKHVVDQASLQVNNHNNNRYKCNQCLKSFSRPSSLRIHILSHTGEKPHVCPQAGCGRRFSVQSNMRRHLKVHYCNTQPGYLGRLQHLK